MRTLLCLVAICATTLFASVSYADPPGDVTLKTIQFVDKAPDGLEAPAKDSQPAILAAEITKTHKDAVFYVAKEGTALVAVVPALAGVSIEHASDCAVNSQFRFEGPPSLVQADQSEDEYIEDDESNEYVPAGIAKRKGVEQLLAAWTRSRHDAPPNIAYTFQPNLRADVTLNRKELDAFRAALKANQKTSQVASIQR